MDEATIQEAFHAALETTDFKVFLETKGLIKAFVVVTAAVVLGNAITSVTIPERQVRKQEEKEL